MPKHANKGTTRAGYTNRNGQINTGRTEPSRAGTDHGQYIYIIKCTKCGERYGANGSDIFERKCPFCQRGRPGLALLAEETNKMAIVAGVDGCKTGWLCVAKDLNTGVITAQVFSNAQLLLQHKLEPSVTAVDIPIGLTEAGQRQCDIEARQLLGPRRSSIFPAPIRPALQACTRAQAEAIERRIDGRGVSAQSFAIFKKVMDNRRRRGYLCEDDFPRKARFSETASII